MTVQKWLLASVGLLGYGCQKPAIVQTEGISAPVNSRAVDSVEATDQAPARKPEIASCAHDPRVMPLSTPLMVKGALSQYDFHIVRTNPGTLGRGINQISLEVRKGPNPATEIASLSIAPTMPDHGHGAQTVPQVHGQKGIFRIDAVDLFMPGVWRIGVRANNLKGETLETGAFYFCIEG